MCSEKKPIEKNEINPDILQDVKGGSDAECRISTDKGPGRHFKNEPHCRKCRCTVTEVGSVFRCTNFSCSEVGKDKSFSEVDWY